LKIKLYFTPRSRAVRPRWLLEELHIPYQLHPIDLFAGQGDAPEYRAIHPLGQVPAIEVDGRAMFESGAICHWLTDLNMHQELAPNFADPSRAHYEQWMFFVPGSLEPPAWTMLLHTRLLPKERRVEAIVPWARRQYIAALEVLERTLQNRPYLLGNRFTTADIMVGTTLSWLPTIVKEFASLQDYLERLRQRAAYQRATQDLAESA
jgi:glutathione S-transferase